MTRERIKKVLPACVLLAAAVVAGAFLLRWAHMRFLQQAYPCGYAEIVTREARRNGLDPALVYAVIRAESNFNPEAESRAGAIGLMQLTPDTFEWLRRRERDGGAFSESDLRRPDVNIRYGCRFLALLMKKYGVRRTALCAYNAGMGTVNAWLKDAAVSKDGRNLDRIPYAETRGYADAVEENYRQYKQLYHI